MTDLKKTVHCFILTQDESSNLRKINKRLTSHKFVLRSTIETLSMTSKRLSRERQKFRFRPPSIGVCTGEMSWFAFVLNVCFILYFFFLRDIFKNLTRKNDAQKRQAPVSFRLPCNVMLNLSITWTITGKNGFFFSRMISGSAFNRQIQFPVSRIKKLFRARTCTEPTWSRVKSKCACKLFLPWLWPILHSLSMVSFYVLYRSYFVVHVLWKKHPVQQNKAFLTRGLYTYLYWTSKQAFGIGSHTFQDIYKQWQCGK